jgi:hypothetical protein
MTHSLLCLYSVAIVWLLMPYMNPRIGQRADLVTVQITQRQQQWLRRSRLPTPLWTWMEMR